MKRTLQFVLAMTLSIGAISARNVEVITERYAPEGLNFLPRMETPSFTNNIRERYANGMHANPQLRKQKITENADGTVRVTCKLNYDPEKFMPRKIMVLSEEYSTIEIFDSYSEPESQVFDLPAGTYDFIMVYYRLNQDSFYGTEGEALEIKELVAVSEDSTIEFDASTTTNHIQFAPYNSLGEPVEVGTWTYTDNPWVPVEVIKGNSWGLFYIKRVFLEGQSILSTKSNTSINWAASEYHKEWKGQEWECGWWINDVSERYAFNMMCLISPTSEDAPYSDYCEMTTRGLSQTVVSNNPENYFSEPIKYDIQHTPAVAESDYLSYPYRIEVIPNVEDAYSINWASEGRDQTYIIKYCPDPKDYLQTPRNIFWFYLDDLYKHEEWEADGEWQDRVLRGSINSQAIYVDTENNYLNGFDTAIPWTSYDEDGNPVPAELEPLTFTLDKCKLLPGASTPYNGLVFIDRGDMDLYYLPSYFGQMGELRTTDELCVETDNQLTDGVWDLSLIDRNIETGGLKGFNATALHIDFNKGNTMPILTGLQCRDKDGYVTDRFTGIENGQIIFYAAGFNQRNLGTDNWGSIVFTRDYSPVEVKVECAPHDSNDFTELEAVENPDLLILPGGGAYYAVNLDNLEARSETGWFDLRLTFITTEGNTMTQTLAPLFYVDALNGIKEIENGSAKGLQYYNLQGIRLASPEKGLNIVRDAEGKTHKVMIR